MLSAIDPGLSRDRGIILRQLAETVKMLARKKLINGQITEEEFSLQVQDCMRMFTESQDCMVVSVKRIDHRKKSQ